MCVVIETEKPQEAGKRLEAYAAALAGGMKACVVQEACSGQEVCAGQKACTEQKASDESANEKAETYK